MAAYFIKYLKDGTYNICGGKDLSCIIEFDKFEKVTAKSFYEKVDNAVDSGNYTITSVTKL